MGKPSSIDHKQVLGFVLQKLRKMTLNGYVFGDEGYTFEWDNSKSKGQNLQSVEAEYALLRYLEQVGVITITVIDNYYRTQQRESWSDPNRGHIIWGGWEEFHPALREFEWLVYVDSIDNAQYQMELSKLGLLDQGYQINDPTTSQSDIYSSKLPRFNKKSGVLSIGDKSMTLKPNTYQYLICKHCMGKFGNYVAELEILEDYSHDASMKERPIRDATKSLNLKADKLFGYPNLFIYSSGSVRINIDLFS